MFVKEAIWSAINMVRGINWLTPLQGGGMWEAEAERLEDKLGADGKDLGKS